MILQSTQFTISNWLTLGGMAVSWALAAIATHYRLVGKINGVGSRVTSLEKSCSKQDGAFGALEKQVATHSADQKAVHERLGRVEKAIEAVNETVRDGNLALGTQLHGIEKLIEAKDKDSSNRIVRLETVQQIEKKIGKSIE